MAYPNTKIDQALIKPEPDKGKRLQEGEIKKVHWKNK